MKKLINEMKNLEVTLEVKHAEKTTDHTCMYCWKPTETSYCVSCEAETDLQNDPFLNTNEEVEYAAVNMG